MPEEGEDLLTDIVHQMTAVKRKNLLPWWIKVFMWIFLIFGAFAPVALIFAILGYDFHVSLYGLETTNPSSITGICLIAIFLLKGITSLGLLREIDWAIRLGIIDAVLGIAICSFVMLYSIFNTRANAFSFRLELAILIPYLIKLNQIKQVWENKVQV